MTDTPQKIEQVADEAMVKNAVGGEDEFDALSEPSGLTAPREHPLWPLIRSGIREIYDPEIPVNIYELGLIYDVAISDVEGGHYDIAVKMTLTSPGCPVAQDMPGWVQGALFPIEAVRDVDVEIVWDPTWTPALMSETAKMQLNMFT